MPTPEGVPVIIKLPFSSVVPFEQNEIKAGTLKRRSSVLPSCLTSSFTHVRKSNFPAFWITYKYLFQATRMRIYETTYLARHNGRANGCILVKSFRKAPLGHTASESRIWLPSPTRNVISNSVSGHVFQSTLFGDVLPILADDYDLCLWASVLWA